MAFIFDTHPHENKVAAKNRNCSGKIKILKNKSAENKTNINCWKQLLTLIFFTKKSNIFCVLVYTFYIGGKRKMKLTKEQLTSIFTNDLEIMINDYINEWNEPIPSYIMNNDMLNCFNNNKDMEW